MKIRIFTFFMFAFLVGCGYKPVSKMSQNVLGDGIYAHVIMSVKDPRNTVVLQDAVKEAVIERFGNSLVPKEAAQTILNLSIKSVKFKPIIYDKNGYVTAYKTKVVLLIDTIFEDDTKQSYLARGEYDFEIEANSVISDTRRYEAIKNSAQKALDEYVVFIAMRGISNGKHGKRDN